MQDSDREIHGTHGDAASDGSVVCVSVDEAFSRGVMDGDFGAVSELVRRSWFELLRSHGDLVRELLDGVPVAQLRAHPLLAMLLGVCLNGVPHRRVRAFRYFAMAVKAARARKSVLNPIDRALILAGQSAAYRLIGRPALGVNSARGAMRALDALSVTDRERLLELPRVYSQVGVSLYYGGRVDDALTAFATGFGEASPGEVSGFGSVSMLAGIMAERGDIAEATLYVDIARGEPWTDQQRSMYPGTFYRIAEAVLALERFDVATAQSHLDAMVHDRRTIEHWLAIARTEAMTALVDGRPGAGLSHLDAFAAMRGTEGRSAAARASLASTRALLQLGLGSPDAAAVIMRRDAGDSAQTHVDRARVELVLGRTGGALRELRSVAGAQQSARTLAEAAAVEAAALLRFSTSARADAVIEHLGSVLLESEQLLALGLLPSEDFGRVRAALNDSGFSRVFEGTAVRALLPGTQSDPLLSERELAVLEALMRTGSGAQIARELVVSVNTVKTQLRSIYRKLQVSSRDEAIAVALDRHLLVRDDD